MLSPTTTVQTTEEKVPANESVDATTTTTACTSAATATLYLQPHAKGFSSSQLIGASLGIGLPLLLGLLGALFVIWKQHKTNQTLKSRAEHREPPIRFVQPNVYSEVYGVHEKKISEMDPLAGVSEMSGRGGTRKYELQAGYISPRPFNT
jgi:hypothetical protein